MSQIEDLFCIVVTCGTEHPRFAIRNHKGEFWTGEEWSSAQDECRLYSEANSALLDAEKLKLERYEHLPCHEFVAPVVIRIYAEEEPDRETLISWLQRSHRLNILATECGNGPEAGTLGTSRIEWAQIRKENSNENQS